MGILTDDMPLHNHRFHYLGSDISYASLGPEEPPGRKVRPPHIDLNADTIVLTWSWEFQEGTCVL